MPKYRAACCVFVLLGRSNPLSADSQMGNWEPLTRPRTLRGGGQGKQMQGGRRRVSFRAASKPPSSLGSFSLELFSATQQLQFNTNASCHDQRVRQSPEKNRSAFLPGLGRTDRLRARAGPTPSRKSRRSTARRQRSAVAGIAAPAAPTVRIVGAVKAVQHNPEPQPGTGFADPLDEGPPPPCPPSPR